MSEEAYVPLAVIVDGLKAVCDARKTGTMYITTDNKKSAQVMVNEGEIVYLYFYNKRGLEALQLMGQMATGRSKFQEGLPTNLKAELPATHDILQQLMHPQADQGVEEASATAAAPAEEKVNAPASPPTAGITAAQKQVLEDALTDYIGPMAAFVCEDHLGAAQDVKSAVNSLAAEIPEPGKAAKFKEQMMKNLAS